MVKLDLSRVRKHNQEVASGGTGLENHNDVRHTVEETLTDFCKMVYETRKGDLVDEKGNKFTPYDVSLEEATKHYYGCDINGFFKNLQIYRGSDSIQSVARRFGCDNLNKSTMESLLVDHASFGNPMATTDINSEFRFIIPEIFTNAIRTGYQHTVLHNNWILGTTNISQETIKMPLLERGDGMPSRVNEGADIPVGSIKFNKKEVSVFKVGTGFQITDELLMASSLDLLFVFLQEVGNDMGIGADSQAFLTLLNGDQADNSESAPVVGTITGTSFAYKDIKRVFTRMRRIGAPASRIIAGEDDGIDVTGIDKFEGFDGSRSLAGIRSIIGVPEVFDIDTYVPPANQMLFLSPERAMTKLQYRGMMTERRRNPRNQTEELYISDWINFAIVKRDARVVLDKSLTYAGNEFPGYMDIDTRINESYQSL